MWQCEQAQMEARAYRHRKQTSQAGAPIQMHAIDIRASSAHRYDVKLGMQCIRFYCGG